MMTRAASMSPTPASAVDALRQAVAELHTAVEMIARENDALRARHERAAAVSGDGPLLLSVPQVAKLISVGTSTCWRMVQDGELPSIKFGGSRRIPREWLERWVEEQAAAAVVEAKGEPWARKAMAR